MIAQVTDLRQCRDGVELGCLIPGTSLPGGRFPEKRRRPARRFKLPTESVDNPALFSPRGIYKPPSTSQNAALPKI